jgi:hypothetical protein
MVTTSAQIVTTKQSAAKEHHKNERQEVFTKLRGEQPKCRFIRLIAR